MAEVSVPVVCTDRGQHPKTLLGDVLVWEGKLRINVGLVEGHGEISARRASECVWLESYVSSDDEARLHMKCPRCDRHVIRRAAELPSSLIELTAAGVSSLDISGLS